MGPCPAPSRSALCVYVRQSPPPFPSAVPSSVQARTSRPAIESVLTSVSQVEPVLTLYVPGARWCGAATNWPLYVTPRASTARCDTIPATVRESFTISGDTPPTCQPTHGAPPPATSHSVTARVGGT